MKAKSNQPFPVQAFGGRRYVPGAWNEVPEGFEEEARRNPYLTLEVPVEKAAEPEPEETKAAKSEPKAEAAKSEPAVKTPVSPTKPGAKKASG